MDTNNGTPDQSIEPNVDTSDWRGQLQPESRQRIVDKVMDSLKRHVPVSGPEGLLELRNIAQRFEEKVFTAATSQTDYLRKISLKMLTMETKSQGTMANNIPSNQSGPSNNSPDPEHGMQPQVHNPGQQNTIPLPNQPPPCLLSQNIQNNIAPQPNLPPVSSLGETCIQNVSQNSNLQNVTGHSTTGSTISQNFDMQNMFAAASSHGQMPGRQQGVPQQQQQLSQNPQESLFQQQQLQLQLLKQKFQPQQSHNPEQLLFQQHQLQQQSLFQLQKLQQQLLKQKIQQQPNLLQQNQCQSQLSAMQPSMMQINLSSIQHNLKASLDSTTQNGQQPNEGDWQEEVYQKIKTMKESYLPELNEMYQKVASTLLQHDSNPQQPKTDQLERLKVYKMMLERIITFLQVSKSNILPIFKEKLGSYEKQIINLININRPRKAMSSLQPVQLPPAHMHSMSQPQSQVTQVQSHENQMNSQSQTANIQNSVATMQQNNMANQALLEEVKVNQRLIYTVVDISHEDVDPTESSGGNNTTPTCDCKEKSKAVLRTATTTENLGKRFWGCRHYKKGVEGSGCGFFMWFRDDSIDERDFVIASQRRKIVKLQTALASTRRWLELLITIICVFFGLNIVYMCLM